MLLKVGEGWAEWGSGRWEGVGCCLLNPEAVQAEKWLGRGRRVGFEFQPGPAIEISAVALS